MTIFPGKKSPMKPVLILSLAALLAAWATFLPSFVFIFLGAPHVERIARAPRISAAMAAVTAAVVGVIATLALLLARAVLFPDGYGAGPSVPAVLISIAVYAALARTRVELHWVLAAAAAVGLALAA